MLKNLFRKLHIAKIYFYNQTFWLAQTFSSSNYTSWKILVKHLWSKSNFIKIKLFCLKIYLFISRKLKVIRAWKIFSKKKKYIYIYIYIFNQTFWLALTFSSNNYTSWNNLFKFLEGSKVSLFALKFLWSKG